MLNFSPGVAYSARVNNVWQGCKDNFAADRVAAKRAVEAFPQFPAAVRAGIGFRARAVAFFTGLELVEPGIVGVPRWRPESDADAATPTMAWCGVGRKPLAA
jgi:hypothetical protein